MFGTRFRKWLPLALVLLFIGGGIALMFLLPEPDSHRPPAEARKREPVPKVEPTPQAQATPQAEPTPTPDMLDDSTDSDLIPSLPDLLDDDDDKGYPTPFAPPEKPEKDTE